MERARTVHGGLLPPRKFTPGQIRVAVKTAHVFRTAHGGWVVRTMGPRAIVRRFATLESARAGAESLSPIRRIKIHKMTMEQLRQKYARGFMAFSR